MCLNHSETIPLPGLWKNCLPQNLSQVPETLGPARCFIWTPSRRCLVSFDPLSVMLNWPLGSDSASPVLCHTVMFCFLTRKSSTWAGFCRGPIHHIPCAVINLRRSSLPRAGVLQFGHPTDIFHHHSIVGEAFLASAWQEGRVHTWLLPFSNLCSE